MLPYEIVYFHTLRSLYLYLVIVYVHCLAQ